MVLSIVKCKETLKRHNIVTDSGNIYWNGDKVYPDQLKIMVMNDDTIHDVYRFVIGDCKLEHTSDETICHGDFNSFEYAYIDSGFMTLQPALEYLYAAKTCGAELAEYGIDIPHSVLAFSCIEDVEEMDMFLEALDDRSWVTGEQLIDLKDSYVTIKLSNDQVHVLVSIFQKCSNLDSKIRRYFSIPVNKVDRFLKLMIGACLLYNIAA